VVLVGAESSLERPNRAIDWRVEWLKRPTTET